MTRRLAAAVAAALMGLAAPLAQAETVEYSLSIDRQMVHMAHTEKAEIAINGTLPGPTLTFHQGDEAVIHVTNHLAEPTSVHWHGMQVPQSMDGAPGFNHFAPILPGRTFTYRFPIRQSGTYWYHAHSLGQEQDGLYGAIVIDPQPSADYVVLLSEFSPEDSADILNHLKMSADFYQYHRRTVGDFIDDVRRHGWTTAWQGQQDWGSMRMEPTDLSDVSGYAFLVNGRQDWTALFKPGQKLRLRFINAATMTLFDVRIPGLKMTVVTADGQEVQPVTVDQFRIGTAETYDVMVEPDGSKAYTIAAQSLDREGFALATLTPQLGLRGDIPAPLPRTRLTMSDMNMERMMRDDPDMDMSAPAGWPQTGAPAGTKILDYGDLAAKSPRPDARAPSRDIVVRLDGTMNRYIWTINGQTFDPNTSINLRYGERVRLTYINDSMMAHPIHLHGMLVQLENGQAPDRLPSKHTIIVPPGQTVSVLLTADQPGQWPLHCHLLYHMAAGMMTTVTVAEPDNPVPPQPMTHEHETPLFHALRLETDLGQFHTKALASWDLTCWVGDDDDKLWLKSLGETWGGHPDQAQLWALYSRNIDRFWDGQVGVRQDFNPFAASYLVLGVTGLAPYFFETEAHLFLRDDGSPTLRLRQENDLLLTNRLIVKPYVQAQSHDRLDMTHRPEPGWADLQEGVQTRYELTRRFAPYADLKFQQVLGHIATPALSTAEPYPAVTFSLGIRWLF